MKNKETNTMTIEAERMHGGEGDLFEALTEELAELTADYGAEVDEALKRAAAQPLDAVDAHRLFTEILVVLRTGGRNPDAATRERVVRDVQRRVNELVAAPRVPDGLTGGGIKLVSKNGLEPREVLPTPQFHTHTIQMMEGYVDVNDLILWKGNHRVELQVEEFNDRNHRLPDDDEMLMLVQGQLDLPSMGSRDPFEIEALARSIARKGVERPPIVTYEGEPKDGNRRIAAAKYVLSAKGFTAEERERARWIRVWRAPKGTTEDQFEAIVVALNFEPEYKQAWEQYVKARQVVNAYRLARTDVRGRFTTTLDNQIKREVAARFAIKTQEVNRYLRMMQWSEDFQEYHEDQGRDRAATKYRANDIFQWFYEIDAGKKGQKLTERLDQDDDLKGVVYDLMYDVLDSGLQVRKLHQVVADENALKVLTEAHSLAATDQARALTMVNDAIAIAARNSPTKKIGFEQWLHTAIGRFGSASPDDWARIEPAMLVNLDRVLTGALGAVDGALRSRGVSPAERP
ncbi:ParB/Srx family N-terminal domain-containing protein [Micromonospora halotolerans]|uniref:ParB/Srx family N-terminal domain-containing protein n=1 Tax=Micromonospora halotolerans TaxID=709879 RepID=A0ABZ0A2P2_9ACTN|nr:ParB/Srx family N-terminal domain-containing protein [Micromonospora halotolerans]WNM41690.1 ParB/Srx family N-terminal domain-containing protein [Micromonospora halotolerans]